MFTAAPTSCSVPYDFTVEVNHTKQCPKFFKLNEIQQKRVTGMMKCREMMFRKALLPILESPLDDQCRSHSPNMHCFKGGDSRTNEQPGNYCAVFITLTADVLFSFVGLYSIFIMCANTSNGELTS